MRPSKTFAVAFAIGALTFATILAGTDGALAATLPNFHTDCFYTHSLPDDPIVYPGQPGASHLHDFFANTSTNANSTTASLQAATPGVCGDARVPSYGLTKDTGGYWIPAAYQNGQKLTPSHMALYYFGSSSRAVSHLPIGIGLVGGNSHALSPADQQHVNWSCGVARGNSFVTPDSVKPYDCTGYLAQCQKLSQPPNDCAIKIKVTVGVTMPFCLNVATGATSYPTSGNTCPMTLAQLPRITEKTPLGTEDPCAAGSACGLSDPTSNVTLMFATLLAPPGGGYYSAHGDYFNAWNQAAIDSLVDHCLQPGQASCGLISSDSQIP